VKEASRVVRRLGNTVERTVVSENVNLHAEDLAFLG